MHPPSKDPILAAAAGKAEAISRFVCSTEFELGSLCELLRHYAAERKSDDFADIHKGFKDIMEALQKTRIYLGKATTKLQTN